MNGKLVLLTLLFQLISMQNNFAQEREYAIRLAGFHIGDLKVKKYLQDTLTCYELRSNVKFWLFMRVSVEYAVVTTYHKEQLISSVVTTRSSKGDFRSTTQWTSDHYVVNVDAYQYKKDTVIHTPIYFNVVKLYFDKPNQNEAIYADNYGIIAHAELRSENEVVVSVMNNPNTYMYDKELLVKAEMYNPIKDYQIKLKKQK